MHHFTRMNIGKSIAQLKHNISDVHVFEYFISYYFVQIILHVLEYNIEILVIDSFVNIQHGDNVGMPLKGFEKQDFSVRSLSVSFVTESFEYFLNSNILLIVLIICLVHNTIGTLAYSLVYCIFGQNIAVHIMLNFVTRLASRIRCHFLGMPGLFDIEMPNLIYLFIDEI
jgi:hypothetical protein